MTSNTPEDRHGRFDDSLGAADAVPGQVDVAARRWLAGQRHVHGLLRALHDDAAAREARVRRLLARLPRRRWRPAARLVPLAATVALALLLAWLLQASPLPRAEALVARALASMAEPVDRAFTVVVEVEGRRRLERDLEVVMRPGRMFRAHGVGRHGEFIVGCDGESVWLQAGRLEFEVPLAEARRLDERFGEVLELGYLDLETLLQRLPAASELRSMRREATADGESCVRIAATATATVRRMALREIDLLVEEATGLVRSLALVAESEGDGRPVRASLRFDYAGRRELGEAGYRRPW